MNTQKLPAYTSAKPTSGLTIIKILSVEEKDGTTFIYYDIGIGPSAGYGFAEYQRTGHWPLLWFISDSPNASVVYDCALSAVQEADPMIKYLEDACNIAIAVDLHVDSHGIKVSRSFPHSRCYISPGDIKVGTTSWAKGSPDFVRASLIAANSGLPVLLADVHEKNSPMVDWCAERRSAIQPMLFPFGDYRLPDHKIVVDRKENLLELYENFVVPAKRSAYEADAILARSYGQDLIYVIGTTPNDQVSQLEDLQKWSSQIPGRSVVAEGEKLYHHLWRYKRHFPNTDFVFCPEDQLCGIIHKTLLRTQRF